MRGHFKDKTHTHWRDKIRHTGAKPAADGGTESKVLSVAADWGKKNTTRVVHAVCVSVRGKAGRREGGRAFHRPQLAGVKDWR